MPHFLFICRILLLGLSIAQVLSTVQVYVSNLDYHAFLTSVQKAGYLAVPNERVFSTLRDFCPAFCGGLFFTFTAGASLTVISAASAWAWDRLFARNRIILLLPSLLLLLFLVSANIQGFSPLITGYLLVIPVVVFWFTLKGLSERARNQSYTNVIYPFAVILLPALILLGWKPSILSKDRFLDIRDDLLLSNEIGRRVNAFYYENSLYSTRVFRSPRQQLIKSCRLDGISNPSLKTRITNAVLSQDYLPLGNKVRPDVRISLSKGHLEFHSHDRCVFKSSIGDFLRNPSDTLKQVERRTEKHTFLLGFTMFSVVFLGALLLLVCTYAPFYLLSGLFLESTPRAIKAGILWSLTLLVAFFAFSASDPEDLCDTKNLAKAMTSDHLHSRITALKYILRNDIDIAGFPSYQKMLQSDHIPKRYWLARALGVSQTPETRTSLHQLLADPYFNVVCMALDSLGRRGNQADIPSALGKIETSDNWYVQWYAYRALRRLGWRQQESDETIHMGAAQGSHVLLCHQFGQ